MLRLLPYLVGAWACFDLLFVLGVFVVCTEVLDDLFWFVGLEVQRCEVRHDGVDEFGGYFLSEEYRRTAICVHVWFVVLDVHVNQQSAEN